MHIFIGIFSLFHKFGPDSGLRRKKTAAILPFPGDAKACGESKRDDILADIELSVIIPAKNEWNTIARVVGDVHSVCGGLMASHEILVIVEAVDKQTATAADRAGAAVIRQSRPGYGGALLEGFDRAAGSWILTMDADLSHPPDFLKTLWDMRGGRDMVIASRWAPGGRADMPVHRYILSRLLNRIFSSALNIAVRDLSSGFRLYKSESLKSVEFEGVHFDILQSILSAMLEAGHRVVEAPFDYRPRADGQSNARIFEFGLCYFKALYGLFKKRSLRQKHRGG